ncbi:Sodium:solute symporter [Candidatus Desulfarcum epimagneticum]|uniref:Sodium:solute symporter n=1 Tax=uncultured Desulfobacteraceae bacterium TaxID=218296 RepID=A0A484HDS1_9BACT|nr:Sodium:solute symporter [uncultured Desulfobacteraceae bacterium]
MGTHVYWLFFFVLLYWSYCITIGVKGYLAAKTGADYFIAGRQLNIWVFVLAATATSFSGWTFVGHPALVWRDGLPYAYASFYAITIPFTGVLFLKRQWLLGKRYGYVTPGEMYSDYYKSEWMRILTVIVALFFSIPYLGIQLRASGVLFNILTDGLFSVTVGMWLLAVVVLVYVSLGGLRSVAYVDTLQCILLWAGICALGIISVNFAGGWSELTGKFGDIVAWIQSGGSEVPRWADPEAVKTVLQHKSAVFKITPGGNSHLISVPGVIQWVPAGGKAVGGAWTGVMILTYMFALMGIHASPAFSMWGFANKDPKPFPLQQVWASSLGIGFALFVFTALQGMGGWVLAMFKPAGATETILPMADLIGGKQANLVPYLIHLMKDAAPFAVGILAICALAAMQSTGAAYMSTASGMLTRDIVKKYIRKDMTEIQQTQWGRFMVLMVVVSALIFATFVPGAIVMLGGLAVSYGFMMYPALIGTLYWPWLTRQGIVAGLICGIIAVTLTFKFKFGLPWGAYPLTIHCAGWGILFNLPIAILISFFTQPDKDEMDRKMSYHNFIREHASLPEDKKPLIKLGWIFTLLWFFFAIGPGCVLGNSFFGDPSNPSAWFMGMSPIWIWQIVWWILGVFMMWFLAFKLEMSTNIAGAFEALKHDIYEEKK